jgi:L-aminopeptidase/D-esterase-like protein
LLSPVNTIDKVNGILLSGGSAYGLNAAAGVMRYLEEHQDGYAIAGGVVPIVPAAVLMDLEIGDFKFRPDAESGYNACLLATSGPVVEGCVGAGAGATVGKMFGGEYMMKSGLGSASIRIADTDVVVGAIVAVNSLGDVLDPRTGRILAGARNADGRGYRDTMAQLLKGEAVSGNCGANTTIGVVATNVPLTKTQLTKVAQMSHDGYARAINPVHTMEDGDTIFALSTGTAHGRPNVTTIGAIAATVMARAIVRAVMQATSVPELNLLACRDY